MRIRNVMIVGSLCLAWATGCGAERGEDNPFNGGPVNTSAPPAMSGGQPGGDSGSGDDDGGSDGFGDETTGGVDEPVGSTGQMTTGDGTTGDGGAGDGMQPGGGMYADCTSNDQCGAFPELCLMILDQNMNTIDGFCTVPSCSDPVADCDPAPAGGGTPVCLTTVVNGMADAVCALPCPGGAGCPATMTCYDIDGFGEVCG